MQNVEGDYDEIVKYLDIYPVKRVKWHVDRGIRVHGNYDLFSINETECSQSLLEPDYDCMHGQEHYYSPSPKENEIFADAWFENYIRFIG